MPMTATAAAPVVPLDDPVGQHRTTRLEPLSDQPPTQAHWHEPRWSAQVRKTSTRRHSDRRAAVDHIPCRRVDCNDSFVGSAQVNPEQEDHTYRRPQGQEGDRTT